MPRPRNISAAISVLALALMLPTIPFRASASSSSATDALAACAAHRVPLTKEASIACIQRATGVTSAPTQVHAAQTGVGPQDCVVPLLDDRCESWAQTYAYPGNSDAASLGDRPRDLVADPESDLVYTVGVSQDASTSHDFVVIANATDTGQTRWLTRWDFDSHDDRAAAAALSPDGSTLYVTGTTNFVFGSANLATVALDTETGEVRWEAIVARPEDDFGVDIRVSPDGDIVYVASISEYAGTSRDVAVTAYRAKDGEQLYRSRYARPGTDEVAELTISPDGETVFAASLSSGNGSGNFYDYVTVAFDAGSPDVQGDLPADAGKLLWATQRNGGSVDWAFAIEPSPSGDRVYVTGLLERETPVPDSTLVTNLDFGTVAYDAATGAELWTSLYHSDNGGPNAGFDLAVSPDGNRVFTTGQVTGLTTYMDLDFGTVALDAANGNVEWTARYQIPSHMFEFGSEIALSSDGSKVYVTGWGSADAFFGSVFHGDAVTIGYDAADGTQNWSARYSNTPPFSTYGLHLAVGPTGVYVATTLFYFLVQGGNGSDIATLAYSL